MNPRYLYGGKPAVVHSAAGAKGIIIGTIDGAMAFRVYHGDGNFSDYDIRYGDLSVTIDESELAAFYEVDGHYILDHSPEVLGLETE